MQKERKIHERILRSLRGPADESVVSDVRIGLGYTALCLSDDRAGLAFTFRKEARGGCTVFAGLTPLLGRRAADLLDLIESEDPIQAGVGLACANAMANNEVKDLIEGDALDHMDLREEDHVGMVGLFGPYLDPIKKRVRTLTVLERVDRPEGILRPARQAASVLPDCQVAVITATSIINHTIDELLEAAGGCREVVILGASTPLITEVFSGVNVSLISGVVINRPKEILRVVSEGGGTRQFKPYVTKGCLRLKGCGVSSAKQKTNGGHGEVNADLCL